MTGTGQSISRDEIRRTVLQILGDIAPEADLEQLKPNISIRDQLDVDSMDLLNVMIALNEELKVEVPEADYPKLATLDKTVAYLAELLHAC